MQRKERRAAPRSGAALLSLCARQQFVISKEGRGYRVDRVHDSIRSETAGDQYEKCSEQGVYAANLHMFKGYEGLIERTFRAYLRAGDLHDMCRRKAIVFKQFFRRTGLAELVMDAHACNRYRIVF